MDFSGVDYCPGNLGDPHGNQMEISDMSGLMEDTLSSVLPGIFS